LEKGGQKVGELPACRGIIKVNDPKPWWPYLMTDSEPGAYSTKSYKYAFPNNLITNICNFHILLFLINYIPISFIYEK
jgi:hypothetical protein